MFDVSWGEIFVLGVVGCALAGKRDLPVACRFVGTQLGRMVGFVQGARAKADQFTQQHQLTQLQNELRSGLRELDQVKMELALAASTQGVFGRSLGANTSSANRLNSQSSIPKSIPSSHGGVISSATATTASTISYGGPIQHGTISGVGGEITSPIQQSIASPGLSSAAAASIPSYKPSTSDDMEFDFKVIESNDNTGPPMPATASLQQHNTLPPVEQTERAVIEEEWEKQGIGFRARAEQGVWNSRRNTYGDTSAAVWDTSRATGSELLEHLERQCLIFDQYDRVVGEKENAIQERIDRIKEQRKNQPNKDDD